MREIKQSTAANVMLFMADSTDHITGKAGLTLALAASKNGGGFNSISPSVTERGSGWYSVALTSSHTDTLGDLVLRATAAGADPGERALNVVASVEADTKAVADAVKTKTDALPSDPASNTQVNTRLAASGYITPDNSGIAAIKAKTDANLDAPVSSIPTNPLRADDARLNRLDAAVSSRSTLTAPQVDSELSASHGGGSWGAGGSIVLPVMQGAVYEATAMQGREVRVVRGDTPRIIFDLGEDFVGWSAMFAAKKGIDDATYAIAVKDCTWSDASKGQGYVELTSSETATVGVLVGEIELRLDALRLTAMRFKLAVLEDVIK